MFEVIKRFLFGQHWHVYYKAFKEENGTTTGSSCEGYITICTSETGKKLVNYARKMVHDDLPNGLKFNKIIICNISKLE